MAQRLSRRLAPFALLAAVLVAVPGPHDGARAAVPGKNGRIAFVRSAGAGTLEEVFMASPGSGLTANLTSAPLTSDTAPSWSPDGTRSPSPAAATRATACPSTSTPSAWPAAGPPRWPAARSRT
jgi:hypothetical protein